VVLDHRGRPKGYGFVRFSEERDQLAALKEMQNITTIGKRPIRVSLATPKKYVWKLPLHIIILTLYQIS